MEASEVTRTLIEIQKDVATIKTDTKWIKKQMVTICKDQEALEGRIDDVDAWKNKVNGALIIVGILLTTFGYLLVSGGA